MYMSQDIAANEPKEYRSISPYLLNFAERDRTRNKDIYKKKANDDLYQLL